MNETKPKVIRVHMLQNIILFVSYLHFYNPLFISKLRQKHEYQQNLALRVIKLTRFDASVKVGIKKALVMLTK